MKCSNYLGVFILVATFLSAGNMQAQQPNLELQDDGYFGRRGFDVFVFNNDYPQGHQSGIEIITHGERIASVGDVRLEPTPGQWSPQPKFLDRTVNAKEETITATLKYPDPDRNRKGFNPIMYPDLEFEYSVSATPTDDGGILVTVDLKDELPAEWYGKVGFNMELYPEALFGKGYLMDGDAGIFPRSPVGKVNKDDDGELQAEPYAVGEELIIAPESEDLRVSIESLNGELQLLDSRFKHNNGWYILRTVITEGTDDVIEWKIMPEVDTEWQRKPVIQASQQGYHPDQEKRAVIEADTLIDLPDTFSLMKVNQVGNDEAALEKEVEDWGDFLRYQYATLDFSDVEEPGLYYLKAGGIRSHNFRIGEDIYNDKTWQATLEYFLPVQMCHMKVRENYRTWHGRCHLDDALMAPTDTNHFDGYKQGESTLTGHEPYDNVPGLNSGGWHDAGDYDLRVESQAGTVHKLALIYENFDVEHDETMVDQGKKLVEMHQPDGKADVLQQIEHGLLTIIGGYDNLGRLYRGIICNDLRQYVLLGDASTMTDNENYKEGENEMDDRWVFTEKNPGRALYVASTLAAAGRVIEGYDRELAQRSVRVAEALFDEYANEDGRLERTSAVDAAAELYMTTGESAYLNKITASEEMVTENIDRTAWMISRLYNDIDSNSFKQTFDDSLAAYGERVRDKIKENPYGVPYDPAVWGAGWGIQAYGVQQYYLNRQFPDQFPEELFLNTLNYVLGQHQGPDTRSYVSTVGSNSVTTAYGINRGDWSFIPGGVISGTGLIRPNFPELKNWPFLWQQTEYVMGGAGTDFMFLSLAAHKVLNQE